MASSYAEITNLALVRIGANRITSMTDGSRNANEANAIFQNVADEVLRAHDWSFATHRAGLRQKDVISVNITTITQANPGTVLHGGGAIEEGDLIEFANVGGMTELNGNQYIATQVQSTQFTITETDTSGFTAYTSGGTAEQVLPHTDKWTYVYECPSDCLRVISINDAPDTEYELTNIGTGSQTLLLSNEEPPIVIEYIKQVVTPGQFDATFTDALAFRLAGELSLILTGDMEKFQAMMTAYNSQLAAAVTNDSKEDKHDITMNFNRYKNARR